MIIGLLYALWFFYRWRLFTIDSYIFQLLRKGPWKEIMTNVLLDGKTNSICSNVLFFLTDNYGKVLRISEKKISFK